MAGRTRGALLLACAAAAAAAAAVVAAVDDEPYLAPCVRGDDDAAFDPRTSPSFVACAACIDGAAAACPRGCCYQEQAPRHWLLCRVNECCARVYFDDAGAVQVIERSREAVAWGDADRCGPTRDAAACGDRCAAVVAGADVADCPFGVYGVPRERSDPYPGEGRCATEDERDDAVGSGVSEAAIAGGVVGGAAVLFLVALAACCGLFARRRKKAAAAAAAAAAGSDAAAAAAKPSARKRAGDEESGSEPPDADFPYDTKPDDYIAPDLSAPIGQLPPGSGSDVPYGVTPPPDAEGDSSPAFSPAAEKFLDTTSAPAAEYPLAYGGGGGALEESPLSTPAYAGLDDSAGSAPVGRLPPGPVLAGSSADTTNAPPAAYPRMHETASSGPREGSSIGPVTTDDLSDAITPLPDYSAMGTTADSSGVSSRYADASLDVSTSAPRAPAVNYPSMYDSAVKPVADVGADEPGVPLSDPSSVDVTAAPTVDYPTMYGGGPGSEPGNNGQEPGLESSSVEARAKMYGSIVDRSK